MARLMQKEKKIRLTGKPLAQLNTDIHERDDHICTIRGCGRYVSEGEKFHHEPCGPEKEDRIEKACLLCERCHHIRHHGREGLEDIKQQCIEYLSGLYPNEREEW